MANGTLIGTLIEKNFFCFDDRLICRPITAGRKRGNFADYLLQRVWSSKEQEKNGL